ncbi:uncharacterized protein ACIB01_011254 [Guaruba guarouba]
MVGLFPAVLFPRNMHDARFSLPQPPSAVTWTGESQWQSQHQSRIKKFGKMIKTRRPITRQLEGWSSRTLIFTYWSRYLRDDQHYRALQGGMHHV